MESLYAPRLRRVAGEIEPLDDEATEDQQDDAMRRLHAAMRDSMTVARANRFVEQLLPEAQTSIRSEDIPLHCDDDLADLIACLLHANASAARYRLDVARDRADADAAEFRPEIELPHRAFHPRPEMTPLPPLPAATACSRGSPSTIASDSAKPCAG